MSWTHALQAKGNDLLAQLSKILQLASFFHPWPASPVNSSYHNITDEGAASKKIPTPPKSCSARNTTGFPVARIGAMSERQYGMPRSAHLRKKQASVCSRAGILWHVAAVFYTFHMAERVNNNVLHVEMHEAQTLTCPNCSQVDVRPGSRLAARRRESTEKKVFWRSGRSFGVIID